MLSRLVGLMPHWLQFIILNTSSLIIPLEIRALEFSDPNYSFSILKKCIIKGIYHSEGP